MPAIGADIKNLRAHDQLVETRDRGRPQGAVGSIGKRFNERRLDSAEIGGGCSGNCSMRCSTSAFPGVARRRSTSSIPGVVGGKNGKDKKTEKNGVNTTYHVAPPCRKAVQ